MGGIDDEMGGIDDHYREGLTTIKVFDNDSL